MQYLDGQFLVVEFLACGTAKLDSLENILFPHIFTITVY
jgi:hypothetical protein